MADYKVEGPDDPLLTLEELAKYLRVSKPTLRRLIAHGLFPHGEKLSKGSRLLWRARKVAAWLEIRGDLYRDDEIPLEEAAEEES